ncbi:MSMEG_0565 family glycosyltransferase [Leptolyngbya sp. FACHB-261]|uniref:MSMEG_0565 family glycosyltransferase n=1 Tax=Leptolyngbya sp. FACHB-261 TaxID=2692806 RepID=UPI0016839D3F|nr:MSMEG_0565 family glycosyltransferase [Leptolyngbya sp. FACHB-261]MBD2104179.1 MSMEG_0565 family glycosyltransferase [Leptolyngbya sp. FACHB-261]
MTPLSPLRIALLTYATKPRGSVVHTLELAEALQDLGHHVCVYALDKDGSGFYRSLRCPHQTIPAQPVTGNIDALIQQRIQEFVDFLANINTTYDCYHAQDCISANALLSLKEKGSIPHFLRTVHHIEDFNSPYLQRCQDQSIRRADRCLCVSLHWQVALQEGYGIAASRVFNAVDNQRFSPHSDGLESELKTRLGLSGWPIYLTVGGIEPRKNSLTLLHAFIQLRQQYPQAQLVIAGGATLFDYEAYRQEFFAVAQQTNLQIGKSLILPGVITDADLPALYRSADAFVFPSLKEGWGLVVLEAMASGLPVLVADQPPFTEFLTAQEALLVDPNDPQALATEMAKLPNPLIAQKLSEAGLRRSADYSWARSALAHAEVYHQFLQSQADQEPVPVRR